MATLSIPDITITPALPDEDSRRTSTTPSVSLPESIIHAFRDVPKELHPRWSDADPIITKEELAKAPPMSKLPRMLLPRDGMPSPPCLQYGLPITLEQIVSFVQLRDPNMQVINRFGSSSRQAERLLADRLTAETGLPVYLQRVANGPGTPFVVCMLDNYCIRRCIERKQMPGEEHICQLQKALGVDPKILPMWYIAGAYNEWEYR